VAQVGKGVTDIVGKVVRGHVPDYSDPQLRRPSGWILYVTSI
jgi:hypothetical protein